MLVTNKVLLDAAREGAYAVGAFNINNMEFVQAITTAAAELKSPVILAVSEGAIQYAGFENVVSLARVASEEKDVTISLHLDHGKDMGVIERCIDEGFTSVMIDGSHLPFDENIAVTRKVVDRAADAGVAVEGELGRLAGIEDNVSVDEENAIFTDPDEAAIFVERTGVDSLAIAVGTSHGAYKFKGEARLAFEGLGSSRASRRIGRRSAACRDREQSRGIARRNKGCAGGGDHARGEARYMQGQYRYRHEDRIHGICEEAPGRETGEHRSA